LCSVVAEEGREEGRTEAGGMLSGAEGVLAKEGERSEGRSVESAARAAALRLRLGGM